MTHRKSLSKKQHFQRFFSKKLRIFCCKVLIPASSILSSQRVVRATRAFRVQNTSACPCLSTPTLPHQQLCVTAAQHGCCLCPSSWPTGWTPWKPGHPLPSSNTLTVKDEGVTHHHNSAHGGMHPPPPLSTTLALHSSEPQRTSFFVVVSHSFMRGWNLLASYNYVKLRCWHR